MHSIISHTHHVCSLHHSFKPCRYTQNSFEAWNNPPLSRCKICKRLIGTTSNLGCRGKNTLVKYFSAFIKHLSSRLCLTEWQGSFSLCWVCVVSFGNGGAGGAVGVVSVRSWQKLPPCPVEPRPAGSKMGPPLAKAEPISDHGRASGMMDLRGGKKNLGRF